MKDIVPDLDPQETQEWLEALDSVLKHEGPQRAHFLLEQLVDKARRSGAYFPFSLNTAYVNTIPTAQEERSPGNHELEHRIRAYVRHRGPQGRHDRVPRKRSPKFEGR